MSVGLRLSQLAYHYHLISSASECHTSSMCPSLSNNNNNNNNNNTNSPFKEPNTVLIFICQRTEVHNYPISS